MIRVTLYACECRRHSSISRSNVPELATLKPCLRVPPPSPDSTEETTSTAPEPVKPKVQPEEPVKPAPAGTVNIILTGCGLGTYDATHVLREMRPDLGTFDLYKLVRNFPQTVAENVPTEEAEAFKKRLEDAGCTVELK